MNIMCPCASREGSVNPHPHPCVWVLPWQAAALVARPVQTVHTWRKRGVVCTRKEPLTGRWQVCNCAVATYANAAEKRWVRSVG